MNSVFTRGCQAARSVLGSSSSSTLTLTSSRRGLSQEAMAKYKYLQVGELKPFVYSVYLNRPDKKNAMNMEMWDEIKLAFEELAIDEDCRSIVLAGNGDLFTSGIDLKALTGMASITTSDEDVAKKCKNLHKIITHLQAGFTALEKCPKPVVAAIHGACVGGGIDLITAADIRYCTKDAWFTVKEVDLGLAADVGTLQRLPKVIGNQSLVRELCFTARKFEAAEAADAGLVSRVLPDKDSCLQAAIEVADQIAQKSPVAVQTTKQSLIYSRDHTVEEGLEHIAQMNKTMLQSNDLMVAAMAMMTKSKDPPTFSKL